VRFDILTLHPAMVAGPLEHSILRRARDAGVLEIAVHDIRDHGLGRHRQVDDTPYGGGAGMVLRADVVAAAIEQVRTDDSRVVLLTPSGDRFDQRRAEQLREVEHLVLVCGHYEGIDARIADWIDATLSIGDYVLTGGELPALVVVEAVARLVPGVLGNAESAADESFSRPGLEYPQYTRPRTWQGREVPEVLLSGHHGAIAAWRQAAAEEVTARTRPDLLEPETLLAALAVPVDRGEAQS